MKKLLFFFFFCSPALGADYYFSDCATGGAGTIGDPYCLDPDSDGIDESFEFLMDGTGAEVVAGDTIYLCAGACDNSGSGTYNIESSGTDSDGDTFGFSPEVSGTAANPITIQALSGETVIVSGDSDGDNINDATDLDTIITNEASQEGRDWYIFRDFTIQQARVQLINLSSTSDGGSQNWTFDNMTLRYTSDLWTGGDYVDGAGCDQNIGEPAIVLARVQAGFFRLINSTIHSVCGFMIRNVNNSNIDEVLIENNEIYNLGSVNNDFNSQNVTIRGNYIHDVRTGISIEERVPFVTIEDNIISCPGDNKVNSQGSCSIAINISNGDSSVPPYIAEDMVIRNNTVWGAVDGIFQGANVGWWNSGINFTATNDQVNDLGDTRIENNVVWHVHQPFGNASGSMIINTSTGGIVIQNNTIWGGTEGMRIISGTGYIIRGNIIGDQDNLEFDVETDGNTIEYNNIYDASGNVAAIGTAQTTYTCATLPNLGSGNICSLPNFRNVSGNKDTWNLAFMDSETASLDIEGLVGPVDDRLGRPRRGLLDMGAFEKEAIRVIRARKIADRANFIRQIGFIGDDRIPSASQ